MSAPILPPTTAGIEPGKFSDDLFFARTRSVVAAIMVGLLVLAFGLRVNDLGAESLGEDELNKLETVNEYRTNGLSGKNGEHPFLMKGLQTLSISASEKINLFISSPEGKIREEAALRFPVALFGTFTSLLIFLLVSELFGRSIGLVSAAFWAVEPMAIGFDRIAKEDSLVLFFFLLTNLFWIRSQTAAERGNPRWAWNVWATAIGFAALMASKYYPHLLGITGAYYQIFDRVPGRKWRVGTARWPTFFVIMGIAFVILNPTIILPDTWREMLKFSSENRIGHDSYEFMGSLYRNQMTAWLSGVPWTFYYVFIAVKTSLSTLVLLVIGLPFIVRRRMGDGRFFLFFWAFMWFLPFTFLGGKFVRYFTLVEPLVLIVAATGFYFVIKWLSDKFFASPTAKAVFQSAAAIAVLIVPLSNSISSAPHFRLFTNTFGGGKAAAGTYFPHDEFYDAATREIISQIAVAAPPAAMVASETPALLQHYARLAGREDLKFISLSDKQKVTELKTGDFVVLARGRRYFSNSAYIDYLSQKPAFATVNLGTVPAATVYRLDEMDLAAFK